MTIRELKDLFNTHKVDELVFQGNCHDCGKLTLVVATLNNEQIIIRGGAVYKINTNSVSNKNVFIKCDNCFKKNPVLENYRDIEVWSRVVGYLRPIQQWNKGKTEEYKLRKVFKPERTIQNEKIQSKSR